MGSKNNRRSFLKRSAITSGVLAGGLLTTQDIAYACEDQEGNYDSLSPFGSSLAREQIKDDQCEGGISSSGTRIDMGTYGAYWESCQTSYGAWEHKFSNHAHAEHYRHTDDGNCDWYRSPGITWHSWRANEQNGHSIDAHHGGEEFLGASPAGSGNDSCGDHAYTGLSSIVALAWPATSTAVSAAALTYSLYNIFTDVSSNWDAEIEWNYSGGETCTTHFNFFEVESGTDDQTHIVSQDRFKNSHYSIWDTHNFEITNPHTDPCGSSSSSSLSSSATATSESCSSTDQTSSTTFASDEKDARLNEGDLIELEEGVGKVVSVRRNTWSKEGGEKKRVDPEKYKERYPHVPEDEIPVYKQRWDVTSTTAVATIKHLWAFD